MSFNEFLTKLGLPDDASMAILLYDIYLHCLKRQREKKDKNKKWDTN